mmetsp:Transcript_25389/g.100214  ORF Transcript_25389/g.100214 Transcript_25389/m.100214 type:complete len:102 (-) Transcript_25389:544-849(-)
MLEDEHRTDIVMVSFTRRYPSTSESPRDDSNDPGACLPKRRSKPDCLQSQICNRGPWVFWDGYRTRDSDLAFEIMITHPPIRIPLLRSFMGFQTPYQQIEI